ncbi:MAG: TonB-dependent receptor [Herminiimonas sp.]|nr:TonB-dependent receptor [Herminiimonas sp.]
MFREKTGVQAVRLAMGVLAGSILLSGGVQAQEAAAEPLKRVEVTGSNIKRAEKEGTSPIETITAIDIKNSGAATVQQLMRQITSVGSTAYNDTPTQNGFSRGVAVASLRNLSATSTLILLNGRRITPSAYANPNNGTSTLYDLNSIPISALERVEIFKDGASAVYGSDAIGGVINFITKSNYQGMEITARAGANDNGNFGQQGVNGIIGFGDLEKNGYNGFITLDYAKKDRTSERDGSRDIAADQYAYLNFRLNPYSSSLSNQPFFYRERTPGGLSFVTGATVVNRTGCDPSRLITGGPANNITSGTLLNRTFCNFDLNNYNEAQSKGNDISLLSRGTFKLNDNVSAFGEFGVTQSTRDYTVPPRAINAQGGPTTNFLLGGLAAPFQAVLPIGHPDNPFTDVRAAAVYRFENLRSGTHLVNESYRALGGFKGTVGTWDWETAVLWNRSDRNETSRGQLFLPTLRTLLTQNRSLAAVAADPTLPYDVHNKGTAEIVQADAKVSTEFGKLAGGPIGFAAGVEFRQEKLTITPDAANSRGDILGLATTQTDGKRNVSSGFFEFRTPWAKSFETDFAGRFDKYPGIKTNFVPKAGAKWTPNDVIAFRGTYAEGFRAPAVSQVSPGGAQFFLNNISDPVRCPNGVTPAPGADQLDCSKSISGVGGSNPALKPETSRSLSLGLIFSPTKQFDLLLDFYKIKKEGEVALGSATTVLEHPDRYPADAVLRDTNPNNLLVGANAQPIPGTGPLLAVKTPWTNQGSTETSGLDLEARLRTAMGSYGDLLTSVKATYVLSYRRAESPGDTTTNVVGGNGGIFDWSTSSGDIPRLKMTIASAWTRGPHNVTGQLNFIDSISLLRRVDGNVTYPAPYCYFGSGQPSTAYSLGGVANYTKLYPDCKVPTWTTIDVGYNYSGIKNMTIGFNIANLFDKRAPYYPGANTSTTVIDGYNAGLHNDTGRYFTLRANYKFK